MAEHEDTLFQQALDHRRAGRLVEASALYQEILHTAPEHTEVLYLLGVIAYQAGQPAHTVELTRRALTIQPDDAKCHNLFGLGWMALGAPKEAEAALRRAVALDGAPNYHNSRGVFLKEWEHLDDAIAAFRQAVARAPRYTAAHYNLGYAHRENGEMEAAAESFRKAVDLGDALQTLGKFS